MSNTRKYLPRIIRKTTYKIVNIIDNAEERRALGRWRFGGSLLVIFALGFDSLLCNYMATTISGNDFNSCFPPLRSNSASILG